MHTLWHFVELVYIIKILDWFLEHSQMSSVHVVGGSPHQHLFSGISLDAAILLGS